MAQVRETRYLCDSCGKQVTRKELRTFQVVPKVGGGFNYSLSVKTDLCDECEANFVTMLADYVKADEKPTVRGYRREAA